MRRFLCASPAYFAARGRPESPADLAGYSCVTFEAPAAADTWPFHIGNSEVSVPIHSRLTASAATVAIDAATVRLGITRVLSYRVASAVRAGALFLVLTNFEPAPWPVNFVYAGGGCCRRSCGHFSIFRRHACGLS